MGSGFFGSGFPTVSNPLKTPDYPEYVNSGWNLNNVSRLPGSLLSFEGNGTSFVLAPRVRAGMCFSTVNWVRLKDALCGNELMVSD